MTRLMDRTPLDLVRRGLAPLRRWLAREDGSISVEAIFVMPFLVWAYLTGFVYFHAFKAQSMNDTATFAIADVLSRQTQMVNSNYLNALWSSHRALTFSRLDTRIRVSQIEFDESSNRFFVIWSIVQGEGWNELSDGELAAGGEVDGKLPIVSGNERLIVVEAQLPYEPAMSVGIDALVFHSFTPIRSRYAPKLCLDRHDTDDINQAEC